MDKQTPQKRNLTVVLPNDKDWNEWENICKYTGWDPNGLLKPMRYSGHIVPYSKELGVGPIFMNELKARMNSVRPIRMSIVGEAGSGKTYTAIEIASMLDKDFCIQQIVITASGYVRLQNSVKPKMPIVLEEPTFLLAARTWMSDWQRIIVQTIESTRFQNNPLLIPVVNRNLLDKTVREYYINYVITLFERGFGRVYRTKHSQWDAKAMRKTAFNIYIYGPGLVIAQCGRTTCLSCKELWRCQKTKTSLTECNKETCMYYEPQKTRYGFQVGQFEDVCAFEGCQRNIYPQYERKRARAIDFYQKQGMGKIDQSETKMEEDTAKQMSYSEIDKLIDKYLDQLKITRNGRIDAVSIQLILEREEKLSFSASKCETLGKRTLIRHPELADKRPRTL